MVAGILCGKAKDRLGHHGNFGRGLHVDIRLGRVGEVTEIQSQGD